MVNTVASEQGKGIPGLPMPTNQLRFPRSSAAWLHKVQ